MRKAPRKKQVKFKVNTYMILHDVLEQAAARACRRCDKHNVQALTESQTASLEREFDESFWLAFEDAGLELEEP